MLVFASQSVVAVLPRPQTSNQSMYSFKRSAHPHREQNAGVSLGWGGGKGG